VHAALFEVITRELLQAIEAETGFTAMAISSGVRQVNQEDNADRGGWGAAGRARVAAVAVIALGAPDVA
jgi:uncharacterized MnhB-related membrane protein